MTASEPTEPRGPAEPAVSPEPAASAEPAEPPEPAASSEPAEPAGLSERDRAVLAMERRGWPGPGAKERAIREGLGLSPTRYYQLLGALLDDPLALEHDPVTVNRLRRVRAEKRRRR
ncbi:DUF3263 domain-containing protein [Streptomyces sp. NPDC056641]|uniref:DUF3263 domain-containing protein n=1 Tax=unclassified Streptomyces TaxID=2593676 RepID=UPI00364813EF